MTEQRNIRLLVSVVTLEEASEAVQGGADILDLKNPTEGSLGAAHPKLITEVCARFGRVLPVSVAIGDFPHLPNSAALAGLCAANLGADFVKIGLFGSRSEQQALQLLRTVQQALALRESKTKLIAAAYGDYRETGTLNPLHLPRIAREAGFSGCMIDTLNKRGACLFDYMSIEDLQDFILLCAEHGLASSLAGSINFSHVDLLRSLRPDIVGVRGAVCKDGVRTGSIDQMKVSELGSRLSAPVAPIRKEQPQCVPAD